MKHARPWFKFLGWWEQARPPIAFEQDLDRFVTWMRDERGLTPCTIDQWRYRTATFLRWCKETGRTLGGLNPEDIDAYFVTYGAQRWSRISAGHIAGMRRGEVAALRLEHIDQEGGQLRIWRLKRRQPQLYPLVPPEEVATFLRGSALSATWMWAPA